MWFETGTADQSVLSCCAGFDVAKLEVFSNEASDESTEGACSRARLRSPRATFIKLSFSSKDISSAVASNPASCLDGFLTPASILRKANTEHPARCANSSWVKSRAFRRRLTHSPKKTGEFDFSIPTKSSTPLGTTFHTLVNKRMYYKTMCQ